MYLVMKVCSWLKVFFELIFILFMFLWIRLCIECSGRFRFLQMMLYDGVLWSWCLIMFYMCDRQVMFLVMVLVGCFLVLVCMMQLQLLCCVDSLVISVFRWVCLVLFLMCVDMFIILDCGSSIMQCEGMLICVVRWVFLVLIGFFIICIMMFWLLCSSLMIGMLVGGGRVVFLVLVLVIGVGCIMLLVCRNVVCFRLILMKVVCMLGMICCILFLQMLLIMLWC